ncbi:putative F-box domain, kelch-type beta propeller, F-box-like domain superfamily [Arabidopsis thaliana]
MTTEEDMRSSSKSPKSFLSLPNDVVLNCLSRVSRTHDPILSLVSKSFRSLVASPDLEAARFRFLNTERCLYIYMLGGFDAKGKSSRRAYVLDCKSHQWRRLPKMLIARKGAAANVIDGKIYVYVGFSSVYNNGVNGGEIYDPKTQTWEPFPQGEEDFSNKEGVTRCDFIWKSL